MVLCLSRDLAQLNQDKHRSFPNKLTAFCMKVTLLVEVSLGLFLVKDLFGNFVFLSLVAGFSNRTRKIYLATSTLRTPSIVMESLMITEFRQTYPARVTHTEPWTGLILTISCPKKDLFCFCYLCLKRLSYFEVQTPGETLATFIQTLGLICKDG